MYCARVREWGRCVHCALTFLLCVVRMFSLLLFSRLYTSSFALFFVSSRRLFGMSFCHTVTPKTNGQWIWCITLSSFCLFVSPTSKPNLSALQWFMYEVFDCGFAPLLFFFFGLRWSFCKCAIRVRVHRKRGEKKRTKIKTKHCGAWGKKNFAQ